MLPHFERNGSTSPRPQHGLEPLQELEEFVHADGFGQVAMDPHLVGAEAVGALAAAGDRDQQGALGLVLRQQASGQLRNGA